MSIAWEQVIDADRTPATKASNLTLDCDGNEYKSTSGGIRRNRNRVSAWEGTLPRLGFGSIDIELLLNYEHRPNTPDGYLMMPPSSPARCSTPPYTPDEKQIRLSDGLVLPTHAINTSSSSITHTAIPSVVRDSTRNQSTLQSSPPAPESHIGDLVVKTPPYKWSTGLEVVGYNGYSAAAQTGSPASKNSLEDGLLSAHPQSMSGSDVKSPITIHSNEYSYISTAPCASAEQLASRVTMPVKRCAATEIESAHLVGLFKSDVPPSFNSRACTPGFYHKSGIPDGVSVANRYLELLRAAAQLTPQSREPTYEDVVVKSSPVSAHDPELLSGGVRIEGRTLNAAQHTLPNGGEAGQVISLGNEASAPPSSIPVSLNIGEDEIYSLLSLSYRESAGQTPQSLTANPSGTSLCLQTHQSSKALVNTHTDDDDDDEDEENGGCSVTPATKTKYEQAATRPVPTHLMQRKPSHANKLIKNAFMLQVQEIASFSTKFQARRRLTKDQKFDNLVQKVVAKNIFQDGGDGNNSKDVHIFVDMSNIFIGFQDSAKVSQGLPLSARVTFSPFCFEHLAFVLERGRKIAKRRLAGSVRQAHQMNSLPSHIREAQLYGYDTKILHQVTKLDLGRSFHNSPYTSADETHSGVLCPRTKLGEQGVDEALHLSMQDSILDAHGDPGVMVLATGDAKPAEYSDGFAHYALKALRHGWHVEVVSWRKCLSGEWKKSPFKDQYAQQFRIILLDDFFNEIHADWASENATVLARV